MPLAGMSLFVHQDFVLAVFLQFGKVEEYPSEKGKWIGFERKADDALSTKVHCFPYPSHPENAEQLDKKTET